VRKRRRAYWRINHPQHQEDHWGCKYHRTLLSSFRIRCQRIRMWTSWWDLHEI
jgi:hypothetical protein